MSCTCVLNLLDWLDLDCFFGCESLHDVDYVCLAVYPILHIQDFSVNLHVCTFFSKLDLVRVHSQISVAPVDIHKTAFITPFGLYEAMEHKRSIDS